MHTYTYICLSVCRVETGCHDYSEGACEARRQMAFLWRVTLSAKSSYTIGLLEKHYHVRLGMPVVCWQVKITIDSDWNSWTSIQSWFTFAYTASLSYILPKLIKKGGQNVITTRLLYFQEVQKTTLYPYNTRSFSRSPKLFLFYKKRKWCELYRSDITVILQLSFTNKSSSCSHATNQHPKELWRYWSDQSESCH